MCKIKDTWIAFCLLCSLSLHCASQRPHVPWTEEALRQPKTYDLNKDGTPDVFYAYDKDTGLGTQSVDWDADGTPEVHRYFEDGQLVLETYDLNFEGQPSLWLHYDKGKLALKEWDEDGDGTPDSHAFLLQQNLSDFVKLLLRPFTQDATATTSMPPPPGCCQTPP